MFKRALFLACLATIGIAFATPEGVLNGILSGGSGGGGGAEKRWRPGHFAQAITVPTTPSIQGSGGNAQGTMNDMAAASSGAGSFQGYSAIYPWYYLENASGGTYSTSIIDSDLTYVATKDSSCAGGKCHLIIEIITQGFSPTPSVPQSVASTFGGSNNTSGSIAPDYVISGLTSGAGAGVVNNANGVADLRFWHPGEMTAFINLIDHLCSVYDTNSRVEGIVVITQTADNVGSDITSDTTYYNASNYTTQLSRLQSAAETACPHTNVIFYGNWANPSGSVSNLTTQIQNAVTDKWGIGGPDILYNTGGYPTNGVQILLGAGGSYGTTNYQGVVPVMYEDEANWYNWITQTSAGTESYEYLTIEDTHTIWRDANDVNGSDGNPHPATWWPAIVSALQAESFRTHSACPSAYTGGCNTTP
jgi:hypothetical protein